MYMMYQIESEVKAFRPFTKKMYQIFNDKSLNILKHSVKLLNS